METPHPCVQQSNAIDNPTLYISKLRYSLKLMFLVMAALSIWLGFQIISTKQQEAVVMGLRKEGAGVYFDCDVDQFGNEKNSAKKKHPWLRTVLGRHWFDTAIGVNLSNHEFSGHYNRAASLIRENSNFSQVWFGSSLYWTEHRINDSIFEEILNCAEWKVFYFAYNDNSTSSLELLGNNQSILYLVIFDHEGLIDIDVLVFHISKMSQLEGFVLSGGKEITDIHWDRLREALPNATIELGVR